MSGTMQESDALVLEQAVTLCELSSRFRSDFSRDAIGAIRLAATNNELAPLSSSGQLLLTAQGVRTGYDLALVLDNWWQEAGPLH